MNLEALLQRADIWRGGEHSLRDSIHGTDQAVVSAGHEALNRELPGGGWPLGALTELLLDQQGIGELQLLMPALASLSREGRWLVWVAPPHLPYAPALATAGIELSRLLVIRPQQVDDVLWSMEQALRSGACGAVLAWPREADTRRLRRLQLAAEQGNAMGVLFRPLCESAQASPAALRLQLESSPAGMAVHMLKRRGGRLARPLILPRDHAVA